MFAIFRLNHFCSFLLQFQEFSLEKVDDGNCYDYVTVSLNEHEPSLTKFCDTKSAIQLKDMHFISDTGYLIIGLNSDGKLSGAGYRAVYYTMDAAGTPLL